MQNTFDVLILIARPAAGKSELIRYLRGVEIEERARRFHIGEFEEIDDFPMLWSWFEEDGILVDLGRPRLHTSSDGYFLHTYLWDLLIRRIGLEYVKRLREDPAYHDRYTMIIEFSRGTEHGGYRRAFRHMSDEILNRAAVLYIDVSYEESVRKNRARYNPERAHSILEHGLPEDKMDTLYRNTDWHSLSAADPHHLLLRGVRIPYAVMENEDDVTTAGGPALGTRLELVMHALWERYRTGGG
jgi:hypothetical protein